MGRCDVHTGTLDRPCRDATISSPYKSMHIGDPSAKTIYPLIKLCLSPRRKHGRCEPHDVSIDEPAWAATIGLYHCVIYPLRNSPSHKMHLSGSPRPRFCSSDRWVSWTHK